MTILVAVLAVLLVLAVSAVTMRRRRGDEAHSVAGYRKTLDTLAGLGANPSAGARRLFGGRTGGPAPSSDAPSERISSGSRRLASGPERDRRWVFDDAASGASRSSTLGPSTGGHDIARAMRGPARTSRYRIGLAVTVTVVVVAVVAVLVHGHHPKPNRAAATGSTPGSASGGAHGKHHRAAATTTTTLPAREQPVSSTPTTATYVPPAAAYALTLAATTGNCWVQVTNAAGTTVLAQTVAAGTRQAVSVSGRVTVLLGAPTVAAVAVDHVPAVLPNGYRSPFIMTFTPSAAHPAG